MLSRNIAGNIDTCLGTSMGRTGYWHDGTREKLDGQNLVKATAGRTDRGHGDSTHRSEQKADDFEKYKDKLRTELQTQHVRYYAKP